MCCDVPGAAIEHSSASVSPPWVGYDGPGDALVVWAEGTTVWYARDVVATGWTDPVQLTGSGSQPAVITSAGGSPLRSAVLSGDARGSRTCAGSSAKYRELNHSMSRIDRK